MNSELLKELSNADSVASVEDEVRSILYRELAKYSDEVFSDRLGSIIFHKKGTSPNPLKIMFCAHIDEVGFMVRHISDIGFVYLVALGSVLNKSKEMQMVRITTQDGKKVEGLLNVTKDSNGNVKEMYVDIGVDSADEVKALGIDVGDMVCFASEARHIQDKVIAGKAMDDRTGCYVMIEAMKRIHGNVENDIYFVGTSSEEVGVRGGKTATHLIDPDIVFALDVANNPELVKNYTNHRLIGKGPMIVHYDKTLSPNKKLIKYVKELASKHGIPYQSDMFGGGGTDAGNAHLEKGGRLALVLGIPLRYCHGSYSFVHSDDLESLTQLVNCLIDHLTYQDYQNFINFIVGLISSAGQSKSLAFEALKKVKTGEYDEARKILEQAKEADLQAHTVQTKLIQAEMSGSGNKPEVGLLMVHAQDHYMTSQLARDLIEELINVFEAKEGK